MKKKTISLVSLTYNLRNDPEIVALGGCLALLRNIPAADRPRLFGYLIGRLVGDQYAIVPRQTAPTLSALSAAVIKGATL